jgi:hypothetical protein
MFANVPGGAGGGKSGVPPKIVEERASSVDGDESVGSIVSKSSNVALNELKAPGTPVDYKVKNQNLSSLQLRRKANKMEAVSSHYAPVAGVKILVSDDGREPSTAMGASLRQDKEVEKSLMVNIRFSAKEDRREHERNANKDLYSLSSPTGGGGAASHRNTRTLATGASSVATSTTAGGGMLSKSKSTRRLLPPTGPRAKAMEEACSKFDSFQQLDSAMQQNEKRNRTGTSAMSVSELSKFTATREQRLSSIAGKVGLLNRSLSQHMKSSSSLTLNAFAAANTASSSTDDASSAYTGTTPHSLIFTGNGGGIGGIGGGGSSKPNSGRPVLEKNKSTLTDFTEDGEPESSAASTSAVVTTTSFRAGDVTESAESSDLKEQERDYLPIDGAASLIAGLVPSDQNTT